MLRTSDAVTICVGLSEIVLFSITIVIAIVAAIVAGRELFEICPSFPADVEW